MRSKGKYRIGERKLSHRKLRVALFIVVVLVVAGIVAARHFLKPEVSIGKAPAPVVNHISYNAQTVTFTEPLFSISLPNDWKPMTGSTDIPSPTYTWQGSTKDDNARWISVFVDRTLPTLAVNRAVQVQSNGASMDVLGDVSDNCTTFTSGNNPATGKEPAKWQGLDFLCDTGNYERNVAGIVSPDGLNSITLKSPTSGTHHFFITYTDNTSQPDYTVLTNALKSFQLH